MILEVRGVYVTSPQSGEVGSVPMAPQAAEASGSESCSPRTPTWSPLPVLGGYLDGSALLTATAAPKGAALRRCDSTTSPHL
jgi:hypothetical protein